MVYSRACLLVSVKVTFVRKVEIRFTCVVTLILFLSKGLQHVLRLCGLMYAVAREFILTIMSEISKCTSQRDFLVWAFCEQCVFHLV